MTDNRYDISLIEAIAKALDKLDETNLNYSLKKCYLDLAIFQSDRPIPLAPIKTFWRSEGLSGENIRDILTLFVNRSLVSFFDEQSIYIHPLLAKYIRDQVKDLKIRHEKLLSAYSRQYEDWPIGSNDGYIFQQLAYHLMEAGKKEDLQKLLFNFKWIMAKLNATDVNALISDYDILLNDNGISEPELTELRLISRAIQLSAYVIAHDKAQFPSQLYGRLKAQKSIKMEEMLRQIEEYQSRPWLIPIKPSLIQPDKPVYALNDREDEPSGHFSSVMAVAVIPGGNKIISASSDHTLRIWDLKSGSELRALIGHTARVNAVAVTENGNAAISASDDCTLKVWNLKTYKEIRTLAGHIKAVNDVAVIPGGKYIVSASSDNTLKIWDLQAFEEIKTLRGHMGRIGAVAATSNGHIISASDDHTLKIWDAESGREFETLRGHTERVNGVAITSDGKRAVSVSHDCTIRVWDLRTYKEITYREKLLHDNDINAVAITPNGELAVSASHDCHLKIWDLKSGDQLAVLRGHNYRVNDVAIIGEKLHAVSASYDGTLRVWDLEQFREIKKLEGSNSRVRAVSVTTDGMQAVSASYDGQIRSWNVKNGMEYNLLRREEYGVKAIAFAQEKKIIIGLDSGCLKILNLEDANETVVLGFHKDDVRSVAVAIEGKLAISASSDKTLKVWDIEAQVEIKTLEGHDGKVRSVAITPDGKLAVSGSDDCTIRVWDLNNLGATKVLKGPLERVSAVAITSGGNRIIAGSDDHTIRIWDLDQEHNEWYAWDKIENCHSRWISSLSINHDGMLAVSASYDGTIKVWDLKNKKPALVATFTGNGQIADCTAFLSGSDGLEIIAGDELGAVHFLQLVRQKKNIGYLKSDQE